MGYGTIRAYGSSQANVWTKTDKIFLSDGEAITWKGFSAFRLLDLYAKGEDIDPYLIYFKGYNLARVWTSVPWDNGWDYPSQPATLDFIRYMRNKGFQVELTLCTDDRTDRVDQARSLVSYLNNYYEMIPNLLLEAVNEPGIHDKLDPSMFKNLLTGSKFMYTSGWYIDTKKHYGKYWADHSSRDAQWFRKGGHNLYEANTGGGPNDPSEPALKQPCIEDEPGKYQDVGYDLVGIYSYAASCVLLGAGATCHLESGKHCTIPTLQEIDWINYFLKGLDVYPAGTYNGSYRRVVELGQPDYARTYCTDKYSIRIKQSTKDHPESQWKPLDEWGICWSL